MTNTIACPICAASLAPFYEGSSDWVLECVPCNWTLTVWVRGDNEPARAREMFARILGQPEDK